MRNIPVSICRVLRWVVPLFAPSFVCAEYRVIDLGTLGSSSTANAVNNLGHVVGYSDVGGGRHAFFWDGTIHDLGAFGGAIAGASGINDADQIVGARVQLTVPFASTRAFIYDHGQTQILGTLGADFSSAVGINTSGQVVGGSYYHLAFQHAFLYSAGQMLDLGTLGGAESAASSINRSGQIVGFADTPTARHAFLYSGRRMTDLGALPGETGRTTTAAAINDAGQIVGYSGDGYSTGTAFLYSNGRIDPITLAGDRFSAAFAINNSGEVVGTYLPAFGSTNHAFFYTSGSLNDLNAFINPAGGWVLTSAASVSDTGLIAGSGTIGGQTHGFLLIRAAQGDSDTNGVVDFSDLLALAQHYGNSNASWQQGDFTGDGRVDFADLLLLAQHYGQSTTPAMIGTGVGPDSSIGVTAAPEPEALGLALIAFAAMRRPRSGR